MDNEAFWDNRSYLRNNARKLNDPVILDFKIWINSFKKPVSILDVGCGNGILSQTICKNNYYTGIDISKKNTSIATEIFYNERFKWINGDYLYYDFKMLKYDILVFSYSIFCMDKIASALGKSRLLLKNEGHLVLYTAVDDPEFRRTFYFPQFYGYKALFSAICTTDIIGLLKEHQFNITSINVLETKKTHIIRIIANPISR
ncbi:class I SAM-dependent methyltransferase [Tenacibaculum aestuariivivum]|uniref:class I SAM-dependent methyltransferase n=1 Tax=Tenacibaculum aestuariivivum TaxID=2006131 RepID=UPI003AB4D946